MEEKEQNLNLYRGMEFDAMQMAEIQKGLEQGLDVSAYADNVYLFYQMREIRKGLEKKLDVKIYSNPEYDWFQMEEIRRGLEAGVKVALYANKKYDYLLMREIRKGLTKQINLIPFVKRGYSTAVLKQVRKAREQGILIDDYVLQGYGSDQLEEIWKGIRDEILDPNKLQLELNGAQMREIRKGLLSGVDVSDYDDARYNWMQMREIRLGLEHNLPIFWYKDLNFSASQMREIRLGLEEDANVFEYASYVWSATDMHRKRMQQKLDVPEEAFWKNSRKLTSVPLTDANKETDPFIVTVSEDGMSAGFIVPSPQGGKGYTRLELIKKLGQYGVIQGILNEKLDEIIEKKLYDEEVEVAKGRNAEDGVDGHYQFFFQENLPKLPKVLEDDSVDYQNVELFVSVQRGQKLASYIPPTNGVYGYDVRGKLIVPKKGNPVAKLHGKGIRADEDFINYYADIDGRVEIKRESFHLAVYPIYVYRGDLTLAVGNIRFKGDVQINGYVGSGIIIEADGNVVIQGNVEAAQIKAGGDVLIQSGVNGMGKGNIRAGGNVYAKYLEKMKVFAGLNIQSNYILNCECIAMEKIIVSGKKGAIAGGKSYAVYGVEAYILGNDAQIKTYFEVGENTYYLLRLKEKCTRRDALQKELDSFKHEVYKYQMGRTLEELKNIPIYQKLGMAMLDKQKEMDAVVREINEFVETKNKKYISISVGRLANPGCTIVIDNCRLNLDKVLPGVIFRRKDKQIMMYSNYS